MRKKEKKKPNPFLILTVLFLVGGVGGFIIKTVYFTPKETIVIIEDEPKKPIIPIQKDPTDFKPSSNEDRDLNYRNNWKDYISVGLLHKDVEYTVSPDGRVTGLNVPIINKTELPIESITVRVYYINPSNRNTLETRIFDIKNAVPGKNISYPGPESSVKGVSVICEIIKIHSANFGLCYDQDMEADPQSKGGFSGNPADPWHCK